MENTIHKVTNETREIMNGGAYKIRAKRALIQGLMCIGGAVVLHLLESWTMGGWGFALVLVVTIPLSYLGLIRISIAGLWMVLKKKEPAPFVYVPLIVTLLYILFLLRVFSGPY